MAAVMKSCDGEMGERGVGVVVGKMLRRQWRSSNGVD